MSGVPTPEELAKVSKLFSLLDEVGCKKLLESAARRTCPVGEVVCREGERGDEFFVVLGGKVAVTADDFGTSKPIALLGRGAFFGEMAVLANQLRSATVTVDEEADLLVFGRAAVEAVLKAYPVVRQALGTVGVRRTEELLEKLSSE